MKKVFTLLAVTGLLTFGNAGLNFAHAEETVEMTAEEFTADSIVKVEQAAAAALQAEEDAATKKAEEEATAQAAKDKAEANKADVDMITQLKDKFIAGGPLFMSFVLICLILGLALSIERIIYLTLATTNTKSLVAKVEEALTSGGIDAAKDVCRNTRGPVASIFYQGLERSDEGIDMVEKSVVSYGGVQMGQLEKGLPWMALMIALAPMLGFMGTVIGMIQTFELIANTGEADPKDMAAGIQVALITTVSGLVVAIILQIFYNYVISKIDSLVNEMEDASISLIDVLVKHGKK